MSAGSTSETILLEIRTNANVPVTGLAFNTAGLIARYTRISEVPVAITLVTQTVTGAYVSGGFKEIDATNTPGLYRFDIPDAALAVGKDQVVISLHGYGSSSTAFYTIQLGNIVTQGQIATPVYSLKSDQTNCDEKLDIFVGSALIVNLQTVDANNAPVSIDNKTCTVRVYDLANTLVASYTPTIQYDSNGELSFNLSTTVTNTAGTYNIYVYRVGALDTVSFGPLQLKVKPL
jgi:hypothetical protein